MLFKITSSKARELLWVFIYVTALSGGCSLYACFKPQYQWSLNESSIEATQHRVLVTRYRPKENPYIINDTLKFHIKEAWLERKWKTAIYHDTIIQPDRYVLILKVDGDAIRSYASWNIDTGDYAFTNTNPRYDMNLFYKLMDSIPSADTLFFPIVKKNMDTLTQKIIGQLILIRR